VLAGQIGGLRPASCSRNTAMICSFVNLLLFIGPSFKQGRTLISAGGSCPRQVKLTVAGHGRSLRPHPRSRAQGRGLRKPLTLRNRSCVPLPRKLLGFRRNQAPFEQQGVQPVGQKAVTLGVGVGVPRSNVKRFPVSDTSEGSSKI